MTDSGDVVDDLSIAQGAVLVKSCEVKFPVLCTNIGAFQSELSDNYKVLGR